LRYFIAPAGLA